MLASSMSAAHPSADRTDQHSIRSLPLTAIVDLQHSTDRDLVARMVAGDERALAAFYDRFGNLAYSLAFQILSDPADAEEAVADAFLQIWNSAATFDPNRASPVAWLSMITRTRALDRMRSRKRRVRAIETATAQAAGVEATALPISTMSAEPDRQAEQSDLRSKVARVLADLPEAQRKVIELAFFGGLSHSEIAEQLNEPLGTVKTRVRTAMTKLRATLAPYQLAE
jgi:RNA polymerase sigma-70 factor, ECF subfamily